VFSVALLLFTAGSLVAGLAPGIEVFLAGRALQGIAGGMVVATSYAIINSLYEDRLRPSMLAAESTAYVMPSLIGPYAVGAIAESLSWRVVFLGILVFVIPVAVLVLPRFRAIPPKPAHEKGDTSRTVPAVLLAISTGVFLIGLELDLIVIAALVSVAGLAGLAVLLRRLMPEGTFRLQPVLPSAIVVRAMMFGTFAVTETFMVYALKEFGGVSASVAGILVSTGALTWVGGSWLQSRVESRTGTDSRRVRVATGVGSMLAGVVTIFGMILLFDDIWFFPAMIGWMLAGLGIGFGLTTAATIAMAEAPEGQEGRVSSSMLLGDLIGASVGVGIGGVLLAVGDRQGWSDPNSVTTAMLPALVLLAIAIVAALRLSNDRSHVV
jgi:MFS family permease